MSELGSSAPTRVLIVQRRLTHYRVPLFERLRDTLQASGVALTLAVGEATADEAKRADAGELKWAVKLPRRNFIGGRLVWQPLAPWVARADHVVLPQETSQLHNLPLLLRPGRCRVALWGHGRDLQARAGASAFAAQALKSVLSRRADWWFAYTSKSASIFEAMGCPVERITTVNNAIETAGTSAAVNQMRTNGLRTIRRECGLGEGPMGLFMGSLTAGRRLDLLIDMTREVQRTQPDFQLVIAGDGPFAEALNQCAAGAAGVHCVGAVHGSEKVRFMAAADVMIAPAHLGLGVLDAFACGVPLVTTLSPGHGPEIAYVVDGQSGLVTAPHAMALASSVRAILQTPALAEHLRQGGLAAARMYTLDAMVQRFARGLLAWRAAPRRGAI